MSEAPSPIGCRADIWLWRARLFKTRGLAAKLAQSGRIRLARAGGCTRLDKASRLVRIGDDIVFAVAGRLTAVRVLDLGLRRGPPSEARGLYLVLAPHEALSMESERAHGDEAGPPAGCSAIDNFDPGLRKARA